MLPPSLAILIRPIQGWKDIERLNRFLPLAILIFFWAQVSAVVGSNLQSSLLGGTIFFFSLALKPIAWLIFFIILAGLFHLFSELFEGKGSMGQMLIAEALSLLPFLLLPSVGLIARFSSFPFFYTIIKGGLLIWTAAIMVGGISDNYGLKPSFALIIFLFPFLLILLFFISIILLAISALILGFL